ncbi:SDR family oxidoreductase [Nonomuraea longicatena]|uniref:NAD(P)H-binding protein n=1 Tax=Nonomuraea longicatena TaxID=83682 RepID=A0ABN1RB43_9ACTN
MSDILVTGATGNVGRSLLSQLAEAGIPARGASRSTGFDLLRPETVAPALDGVESVFLLWPTFDAEQARPVVELMAERVRRIVYLSATTAENTFHGGVERIIEHSGVGFTLLRPGGFATNTLGWADQIRAGVVQWPYGKAGRSLIHEADIAAVAAHVLITAGHSGRRYALSGPEVITQEEQVRVIGEVIGREVVWEELDPEVARERLAIEWGGRDFADAAIATWASMVDSPEPVFDTVPLMLGRPARTFREWAEDHASDFR